VTNSDHKIDSNSTLNWRASSALHISSIAILIYKKGVKSSKFGTYLLSLSTSNRYNKREMRLL